MFDIIFIVDNRGGSVRSNKGQALLEFILILPVFLMLFLGIIDFGRIIYEKNRLESISNEVVDFIKNDKLSTEKIELELKKNYDIPLNLSVERKEVNTIIKLSLEIDVLTPGLGIAIPDPYIIEVSRVIHSE